MSGAVREAGEGRGGRARPTTGTVGHGALRSCCGSEVGGLGAPAGAGRSLKDQELMKGLVRSGNNISCMMEAKDEVELSFIVIL